MSEFEGAGRREEAVAARTRTLVVCPYLTLRAPGERGIARGELEDPAFFAPLCGADLDRTPPPLRECGDRGRRDGSLDDDLRRDCGGAGLFRTGRPAR